MSEVKEFPPLTERERRLIINALGVAGAEFGTTKIEHAGLWEEPYRTLKAKLGYPTKGWGIKDDRPICAHGCVPAFLDNNRAQSCWKCGLEIVEAERDTLRHELEQAKTYLGYFRHEIAAKNARIKALEAEVADKRICPSCHCPEGALYSQECIQMRAEKAEARVTELQATVGVLVEALRIPCRCKMDRNDRASHFCTCPQVEAVRNLPAAAKAHAERDVLLEQAGKFYCEEFPGSELAEFLAPKPDAEAR